MSDDVQERAETENHSVPQDLADDSAGSTVDSATGGNAACFGAEIINDVVLKPQLALGEGGVDLPQMLETVPSPIAVVNQSGEICYNNQAFAQQILAQEGSLDCNRAGKPGRHQGHGEQHDTVAKQRRSVFPLFFEEAIRETFQAVPVDLRHRLVQESAFTMRLSDSSGARFWQFHFGALCHGQRLVFLLCLTDVSGQITVQECDSEIDPLTGLGNRKRMLRLSDESSVPVGARSRAVMVVDLNQFRRINDTLGYTIGDHLLKLVAARLKRAVRPSDPLMRLQGDEFVVFLEGEIDSARALALGERILDLLSRTFLVSGHQIEVSASVGLALADATAKLWSDLVRQADLALALAKKSEQGCVEVFTADIGRNTEANRQLELALKSVLLRDELRLVYQPQVSLTNGEIIGVEALLRWVHPTLGLIGPDRFLPIAEYGGMIHSIGEWVLREACQEALRWPAKVRLAVNASPLELAAPDYATRVMQVLTSVGLAPERLEIEVTEKLLLEPSASKQISALRSMGVGVALDDFGVGYSALGVLSQHQFSKIKLDNSFFRAPSQPVSAAMIKIVLSLGHALSVPVVAEGVQSQADCQALREHGCAAVQGFLISKPLSPTRLLQLVHSQSADATGAPHCEE